MKIDNMVDLRAFCVEQAVKMKISSWENGKIADDVINIARSYEKYIIGNSNLPNQPVNTDNLLRETLEYLKADNERIKMQIPTFVQGTNNNTKNEE